MIAPSTENPIIGIDLGTTHSLVSFIKNGSPRIIPNERGERLTPSVVFFREEDNGAVVGELARNQAVLNSERTISKAKLAMGRDRVYRVGERKHTPAEISGRILAHLKSYAERYLGRPVRDAVITVPAYFDERQREQTLVAAEWAELNVLKLLNEPTAAALAYAFGQSLPSRLLVIDFGGGTLDITLMEYADRVFHVRGVGGDTAVGGGDCDAAIVARVLNDFKAAHGIDLSGDRIALQQLIIQAERAKIDLSSAESARILIPYITATDKGPVHLNMGLDRKTFHLLIRPVLRRVAECVEAAFEQAGLSPDWVETAILVGGATRMPVIEELARRFLRDGKVPEDFPGETGDKGPDASDGPGAGATGGADGERAPESGGVDILRRNINPDEAVARGAGILAGIFEGSVRDIKFHDITPHDLGLEDDQGEFVTVMRRGTPYPAEAFQLFTNTEDGQAEARIHVLQRVGGNGGKRVCLGWFRLAMGAPRKRGEANIDVRFSIDANGLLNVSAVDLDTGAAGEIHIEKVI